jgi:lipoprotein-anchoring transpeptidase ErfK/SrfK
MSRLEGRRCGGAPLLLCEGSLRTFGDARPHQYDSTAVLSRLLLAIVVVACVAPVLSGDAAPPVLAPEGVTLAGVPVGGMSYEQAQAAVRPAFARPIRVVYDGRRWRLDRTKFGGSVALADGVSRALAADPGEAVELTASVDVDAVKQFVRALDKRISYPAKDAELVGLTGLTPDIADAEPGLQLQKALTVQRITRALESATQPRVRAGVRLVAPAVTRANFGPVIVIRRGSNELRYYEDAKLVHTFGVATGQSVYPTPTGQFSIVDMQLNPWWRPPDSAWARGLKPIPPGPGNPLGTRWMGLSAPGVGIHGTPDDASIGYSASHGCIRMHIPDAEWLFQHVHVGTQVIITDA